MIWEKGNEKGVKFGEFGESDKESIIEAINSIDDQNKREAFGKSQPEVHIWNDVYEFVETRPDASGKTDNVYKYEKKWASS